MNQQSLVQRLDTVLIVDTETSGLPDNPNSRTIEIAALWWHIDYRCVLGAWSELVQQDSNAAEKINRIPPVALPHGLPPEHAAEGFLSRVARADVLVAHRAEFNRQFVPKTGKPWVCTKFDFEWPHADPGESLIPLAIAHGVGVTHAHRALTDCMLLARLFESVDDVRGRLVRAMRPKKCYRAMVSYEDRELAKRAGFRWVPETKQWLRDSAELQQWPFKAVEVPREAPDARDGRMWRA